MNFIIYASNRSDIINISTQKCNQFFWHIIFSIGGSGLCLAQIMCYLSSECRVSLQSSLIGIASLLIWLCICTIANKNCSFTNCIDIPMCLFMISGMGILSGALIALFGLIPGLSNFLDQFGKSFKYIMLCILAIMALLALFGLLSKAGSLCANNSKYKSKEPTASPTERESLGEKPTSNSTNKKDKKENKKQKNNAHTL